MCARHAFVVVAVACAPAGSSPRAPGAEPVTAPGLVEDRFPIEAEPIVDLLFVIPNTPGSAPLQDAVADAFPAVMEGLSGTDWRVGVVVADIDDPAVAGRLLGSGERWVDPHTADPDGLFAQLATPGERGMAVAQPFGAVYLALGVERDDYNAGFLRDVAALQAIIVGDGIDTTDPARLDPAGFAPWFDTLKPDRADRALTCLLDADHPGSACGEAAGEVGGGFVAVVDEEAVARVGLVAAGHRVSYTLGRTPLPGTIRVVVEDVSGAHLDFSEGGHGDLDQDGLPDGDWILDPLHDVLTFLEYVPDFGSTVVVSYEAPPA